MRGEVIFVGNLKECNDQLANRIGGSYEQSAKRAILKETGNASLANSFTVFWDRDPGSDQYTFTVRVFTKVLIYLEKGTKPHRIQVPNGKAVPMRIGGRTIFRKVTMKDVARGKWEHPGTEPKRMFRNAWEEVIRPYKKEVEDATQYDQQTLI